jgi:acyl phosphate:glycerol-3-phosphate acyltransferase
MTITTIAILTCLAAYLLGSIPTAVWIGKAKYNIDVREHGSRNAGATNVFRVLGKKPGIVVLTIDICKGIAASNLPYILGSNLTDENIMNLKLCAGVLAVVGHVYPLFAQFNGGKGVATSLGVITGIHPPAAIICMILFLALFIITQYVSLGAIVASISFPFSVHFLFGNQHFWLTVFSIVLSATVIGLHEKNIRRLIKGEEGKMNLFKK